MAIENKIVKFGIIGTGSIAKHHATSIQELENCQLVSLASSTQERADKAAVDFGVATYADYNTMIKSEPLDAIIVCTHSGNHLNPTIAAAKAGKHVLVEKPLEINIERAQQMITVCREAEVQLSCIFQNRFSPDYILLKNAVSSGILGKLIMGNAFIPWYRNPEYYSTSSWKGTKIGDGGAAFINQGVHTIDLLLDIMGPAKSVFGKIQNVVHDIEGEDLGIGLVTFGNGALGSIQASTALYPGYPERLEIYGDKGSVILEAGKIISWNIQNQDSKYPKETNVDQPSGSSDPTAISHELHKAQIKNFADSILNDNKPKVAFEEGLKALELILGLYESSDKNIEVML